MPIKIPENLPAYDVLTREGVMVMGEDRAPARTSGRCRSGF
jgi:homoserine O-succinyltransferase